MPLEQRIEYRLKQEDKIHDETDTVSKRHSLQAVELSQRIQTAVQIVSKHHVPSNEGPIYRFSGQASHAAQLDGRRCSS